MKGSFKLDDATSAAVQVAYLAAKILVNDLTPIQCYNSQSINDLSIDYPDWNFLNRLRKQPGKLSFYYWLQTAELIKRI